MSVRPVPHALYNASLCLFILLFYDNVSTNEVSPRVVTGEKNSPTVVFVYSAVLRFCIN